MGRNEAAGVTPRHIRDLKEQLDRIEATLAGRPNAGKLVFGLEETARMIGRGPDALRHWLKDEDLGKRQKVDLLLFRAGGRWVSTPDRVDAWLRAFAGASET